ncbi:MAG: YqaJ viral recombinase family protein [Bacteroidetes bacterium]|nr:YqaJ viral recombinase family protein [Bacteroidota bacterium]
MKNFITGSDLSAIIGLNPYKTPYAVWSSIVNSRGEKEPELSLKISNILQPAIAALYEEVSGRKTIIPLEKNIRHEKYNFIAATPNRLIEDTGVLQTYGTQKFVERDFIPQHWYLKIIWDMGVTNKKEGVIAWLERGLRFKYTDVQFDEELFNHMLTAAIDFWNEHVQTASPPKALTPKDIKSIFRKHCEMKFVPADEQSYNEIKRMKLLKDEKKFIESELENIQSSLEFLMGDAEGITYGDKILATWKTDDAIKKFNESSFRKENPEAYQKYLTEVEGKRRFILKY